MHLHLWTAIVVTLILLAAATYAASDNRGIACAEDHQIGSYAWLDCIEASYVEEGR